MANNIIDITDSDISIDSDADEPNKSKEFRAVVEKLERYMKDDKVTLSHVDPSTVDIFDVTISGKLKCLLHPSLNRYMYRGLMTINSLLLVKDFDMNYNDSDMSPEEMIILKDIEVLEFHTSGNIQPDKINLTKKHRNKETPLTTSRNYYLPLYNNEDFYGSNWKDFTDPLRKVSLKDVKTVITIQDLATSGGTAKNPVYGTVIAKSKLKHFGKTDDKKGKYPYTFCIEIEHNGWTCCVSFWNNTCLTYFKRISVGDNILVRNYRHKKRYSQRSNTVYKGQDANAELSINPANPEGIIECLQQEPSAVPYRFKTSLTLNRLPNRTDTILDIVGIITFVGRWEREKKLTSAGICCQDFWMYRWITLNDFTSKFDIKLKLYSCSQPEVLNNLSIGDLFIGSRLLYHLSIHKVESTPKFFFYLTTTRESQLYRLCKDWSMGEIQSLPFVKHPEVLEVLKASKDKGKMGQLVGGTYTGGYFTYPPLPHTLDDYKALFTPEHQMEVTRTSNVVRLVENMHVYQSIRSVCVQANIAAVEIITDNNEESTAKSPTTKRQRKSRRKNDTTQSEESSSDDFPLCVVDKISIDQADQMERIGDINVTDESRRNFIGFNTDDSEGIKRKSFIRILLTSLNKDVAILATFLPRYDKHSVTRGNRNFIEVLGGLALPENYFKNSKKLLKDVEEIKSGDRFLFVLDLYYFGNNVLEVTINRAFPLE